MYEIKSFLVKASFEIESLLSFGLVSKISHHNWPSPDEDLPFFFFLFSVLCVVPVGVGELDLDPGQRGADAAHAMGFGKVAYAET